MFKLGIVSRDQLRRPRTLFGALKFPSLLLLADLAGEENSDALRDDVLRMVQMANGTWKDSRAGRLRVLDAAVRDVLRQTRECGSSLRVLDLGVASGITSVELEAALRSDFAPEIIATDLWRDAFAVRSRRGWCIVLDARGNVLQHIAGPFVLPGQSRDAAPYVLNHLLRVWSERRWVPQARRLLAAADLTAAPDFVVQRLDGHELIRLPLLSAACLRRCAENGTFRFVVVDVLQPLPFDADVVRAVNLLTPHHLGPAELRRALENCRAALRVNGLLVVGRSPNDTPEAIAATIFHAAPEGWRIARRLNGGAEIEPLAVELFGAR